MILLNVREVQITFVHSNKNLSQKKSQPTTNKPARLPPFQEATAKCSERIKKEGIG